jgi:hypothetical protein
MNEDVAPAGRPALTNEELRRRIKLAQMEADMAYFQARIEILGEPATSNQRAQRKTFKMLHKIFGHNVIRAKRRMTEQG